MANVCALAICLPVFNVGVLARVMDALVKLVEFVSIVHSLRS